MEKQVPISLAILKTSTVYFRNMELHNGGIQTNELLDAQAHIWNHIFSFINSMSLKCAIQLNIPDIINHHGAMTVSELVMALQIPHSKSNSVCRLMRLLTHSGFFHKQKTPQNEEEAYTLTPASRLLLKSEPLSVTPFLLAMLDPVLTNPWHHVSEWFQNDAHRTPFETAHGPTFWDYMGHKQSINLLFNDAMASDARLISGAVIKECGGVFEDISSLVDVGGGTGTVAKVIADAFPDLKCFSFDLPHVVAGLEGSNNLSFVEGDMFQAVPPADAVLLKWMLHDWNDEECVSILKRCKEAIAPSKEKGGKVIIIDMIVKNYKEEDHKSMETQLFFDMLMMILVGGKERDEKDWAKLFEDAGYTDYKITPILGLRSLIEVYP